MQHAINNLPIPNREYKVLVRCFTFNQKQYIEDTLNGFAMQKTDFPFVCLVMDDASTDGEQDTIRSWMENQCDLTKSEVYEIQTADIIYVPHRTNLNCFMVFYFLKENLYCQKEKKMSHVIPWRNSCKYEAFCEGDDYWVDPLKIQKEYTYLESNPQKSLVYTNCNVYLQDEGKLHKDVFTSGYLRNAFDYKNFLLNSNYLAPCSWMGTERYMRLEVPPSIVDATLYTALSLFETDSIGYINETTCTYRVIHEGASHSSDLKKRYKYAKNVLSTYKLFINKTSNIFTANELVKFYNERYRHLLPYALVLNDSEMLKEILSYRNLNLDTKGKLMIVLSKMPPFKKYMRIRLTKLLKKGL